MQFAFGESDELEEDMRRAFYGQFKKDIKVDDKLVSSGLGGRFPPGYPVGTVESIRHDSGANFIEVKITPSAEIDRSKHLLLVFTSNDGDTNRQIQ